ncbi:neuropeptide S receptor [Caerostris extrusa]|uniref:Neuropeptide S receptor n=1 Tax=Caerostris extrusa TaxID=172846 RepID=A0AAV4WYV7_CAEEX|nr:neuropeptide S receptor [Caerostris extrusa]
MVIEDVNNSLDKIWIEFPTVSVNSSDVPSYDFGPEYHRTVRLYTLFVMFIFSLLGNTLVVKQLLPLTRRRFPKSKVLFLNLAAADLFVTFATMLSQFIWELMDQQWIAGDVVCKLFKFFQTYSLCSSTFMLVAIALDRYNAIVRPLSSSLEPKYYALIAWFVASLPAMPCLIVFHVVQPSENVTKCVSQFYTSPQALFWRQAYVIFCILWSLSYCLHNPFCSVHSNHGGNTCTFLSVHRQSTDCFFFTKGEVKTMRMTSAILLAFIVLNFPYIVQESLISFGYSEVINKNISALAGVISASNSALNPYIYLTFQSKKTFIGRCLRSLITIIRSKQWSSASQRKDTSFVSGSSKTSSRFDVNALSTVPPTQAAKVAAIINGEKKVDETFV